MSLTREAILAKVRSHPAPSKRQLALNRKALRKFYPKMRLWSASWNQLYFRLGVAPIPHTDSEEAFERYVHARFERIAAEIYRWTGERLSAKELPKASSVAVDAIVHMAVKMKEDQLRGIAREVFRLYQERNVQLSARGGKAAEYIVEHQGCTGAQVANAIHCSEVHFRKNIVPRLTPFGLFNSGGYYMPPVRIV